MKKRFLLNVVSVILCAQQCILPVSAAENVRVEEINNEIDEFTQQNEMGDSLYFDEATINRTEYMHTNDFIDNTDGLSINNTDILPINNTDGLTQTRLNDATGITVEGVMPEQAQLNVIPLNDYSMLTEDIQNYLPDGTKVKIYAAYDISISAPTDSDFQPEEYGTSLTMNLPATSIKNKEELQIYHIADDGTIETVGYSLNNLYIDGFSTYAVGGVEYDADTTSYLLDGPTFNSKLRTLSNSIPGTVTNIVWADEDFSADTSTITLQSQGCPVYAHKTQVSGKSIIELYTTATTVYFNENAQQMFSYFGGLEALDMITDARINTSLCTDMSKMFYKAFTLSNNDVGDNYTLDCTRFNTSNVTNMSYMFGCDIDTNLFVKAINISGWDTSNVTNMECMFSCAFPKAIIGIESLDTSAVTTMADMFSGDIWVGTRVEQLNLSSWNVSNVTSFKYMFGDGTYYMDSLDLSGWQVNPNANFDEMFYGIDSCTQLHVLKMFDMTNVTAKIATPGIGNTFGLDNNEDQVLDGNAVYKQIINGVGPQIYIPAVVYTYYNGDELIATKYYYVDDCPENIILPDQEHMTFAGWKGRVAYGNDYFGNTLRDIDFTQRIDDVYHDGGHHPDETRSMKLEVQWAPEQMTVTFDANGGQLSSGDTILNFTCDYNTAIAEPKWGSATKDAQAVKDDLNFNYWSTKPDGSDVYNFSTPVTQNITLYAQYIPNSQFVNYYLINTETDETIVLWDDDWNWLPSQTDTDFERAVNNLNPAAISQQLYHGDTAEIIPALTGYELTDAKLIRDLYTLDIQTYGSYDASSNEFTIYYFNGIEWESCTSSTFADKTRYVAEHTDIYLVNTKFDSDTYPLMSVHEAFGGHTYECDGNFVIIDVDAMTISSLARCHIYESSATQLSFDDDYISDFIFGDGIFDESMLPQYDIAVDFPSSVNIPYPIDTPPLAIICAYYQPISYTFGCALKIDEDNTTVITTNTDLDQDVLLQLINQEPDALSGDTKLLVVLSANALDEDIILQYLAKQPDEVEPALLDYVQNCQTLFENVKADNHYLFDLDVRVDTYINNLLSGRTEVEELNGQLLVRMPLVDVMTAMDLPVGTQYSQLSGLSLNSIHDGVRYNIPLTYNANTKTLEFYVSKFSPYMFEASIKPETAQDTSNTTQNTSSQQSSSSAQSKSTSSAQSSSDELKIETLSATSTVSSGTTTSSSTVTSAGATTAQASTTTASGSETRVSAPQTGDTTPLFLLMFISVASIVGITIGVRYRKR